MYVSRTAERREIVANDGCRLRELLHPERDPCALPYSLAVAWVEPGRTTLPHRLEQETEVYYIVRGTGRMHVGAESRDVRAGDAVVVPAGEVQWVACTGSERLEFLNLVSPPWRAEHDVRADDRGQEC